MDRGVQFNERFWKGLEHEERDALLELRFGDVGVTGDSSGRDIDNAEEGVFGGADRAGERDVLSKPHVLKTLLKDDPESVTFLMESANQFAMKAIVVSGKETGSSMLRRSASLSATSRRAGGIDQEEEAATQFDNVDFRALKRAANLLRATLDGREYAHTWATEVIRDSKVRLAEEKASLVAASTEAKMGEDDEAMTMSTTSSSFTDAAIATVTGEQHQRPRESRDSNRAVKEREAIANAQRKCEKADETEKKPRCERSCGKETLEQSDVAKEKETLREISTTGKKCWDHLLV